MLIKLGGVLDGWRPAHTGGPGDPLGAVRAAWSELVGADVARAAQPVSIAGDALVVITTSSAWSHQLVFLEPEIVRGLRAIPATAAISRLKFRVGTLRKRGAPGGAEGPRRARAAAAAEPPAKTVDDALARLRRTIERGRKRHRDAGGVFCALCDAAIDGNAVACRPCRDDEARRCRFATERLLFEAPWLGANEVLALVDGLTPDVYDAIRRSLLRSWRGDLRRGEILHKLRQPVDRIRLRKIASSLVLLDTGIDPTKLELDSWARKQTLGDLYDFVVTIESGKG